MTDWKYNLKILLTTIIIIFIVGGLAYLWYNADKSYTKNNNNLCKKICERKGYEFVRVMSEWSIYQRCKCIDKFGEIIYFSD